MRQTAADIGEMIPGRCQGFFQQFWYIGHKLWPAKTSWEGEWPQSSGCVFVRFVVLQATCRMGAADQSRGFCFWQPMAVSTIWGVLVWMSLYNETSTTFGSVLGPLILGNSCMYALVTSRNHPKTPRSEVHCDAHPFHASASTELLQ